MRQTSKAKKPHSFATRAIHHGYDPLENEGSLTPPIHMTSTFVFETTQQGSARFAGGGGACLFSHIKSDFGFARAPHRRLRRCRSRLSALFRHWGNYLGYVDLVVAGG